MDVVEAVNKRKSIRAFKPTPVPQATLKEIMESALRAPSWSNTQPWEFAIVTGRELAEIRKGYLEKIGEGFTANISHPREYPEPYDTRRHAAIARSHEAFGIRREDNEGRRRFELQQLSNFRAPCEIYLFIDRSFYLQGEGVNVWPVFDCGLIAENIMLLATSYGLGTIAQGVSVGYPDVLRRVLGTPDTKIIVLGIAIGYPDWDEPINQYRSEREPLDRVVKWYGFDT